MQPRTCEPASRSTTAPYQARLTMADTCESCTAPSYEDAAALLGPRQPRPCLPRTETNPQPD